MYRHLIKNDDGDDGGYDAKTRRDSTRTRMTVPSHIREEQGAAPRCSPGSAL